MTSEEAIKIAQGLIRDFKCESEVMVEFCNTVIQALKQEPKIGHWVEENINEYSRKVFCSECGCPPPFEHVSNGDVYSASGHGVFNNTKFCPNCGAKMESKEGFRKSE